MTSIPKNVSIDKLVDIVDKCNNAYHIRIKMKPVNVKSNTYINCNKELNDKDHKFKNGDIVRISKYINIFAKSYIPNWSEEMFVIKKVKNTTVDILVIVMEKKLLERFTKKYCKKKIKKSLELKN